MKLDNRIWIILTIVVSGAVLAGAWFLGASPLLTGSAQAAESLASVTEQNQTTSAEINSLKESQGKLSTLKSKLETLREAVPTGVDGSSFISQVDSIADAAGVSVESITLGDPVAYSAPASADTAASGTGAGTSASPSASPSASASPTAAAASSSGAAPVPVTDPLVTSANFVVVPVHLQVKGAAAQTDSFLHGIQYGKRLLLVTEVTRSTDKDGVTLSLGGSIYVIKDPSTTTAATAGASANG